jgi:hypothetical protein
MRYRYIGETNLERWLIYGDIYHIDDWEVFHVDAGRKTFLVALMSKEEIELSFESTRSVNLDKLLG